ncbi:hypothetical protein HYFRA_00005254 [Hymenoscyphus fraxineus]|uniref:Sas10 C-terminal domain-containing protein n=1 Tax=Hymenoscyphus fraxineus TaxID=746836 RepID=A0A9N9LEZ4_9HELO|nr:hypothetical protein HYFRA_00005254 [Hymenoscyphus fraxineus]
MAKKRKATGRSNGAEEVPGFEPRGGKHHAITTHEDVADSEDEFHINRDKVMLDDGPDAKRRRKWEDEDAELEPSDDEVLAYSSSSDDDEEPAPKSRSKALKKVESDEEGEGGEEEEEEAWGTSRKDYYNADEIQTEADALEEEAEAKRIQQKKLQKMTEADFGFDESDWLDAGKEDEDDAEDVVTEVLKDVEITPEMSAAERLQILRSRYPEFEFLADEFVTLQPVLVELQKEMDAETITIGDVSPIVVKCRALAAYMASLTMYFAILSSTAGRALDPSELRDHAIMESLLQCRTLWSKVKSLEAALPTPSEATESDSDSAPEEEPTRQSPSTSPEPTPQSSKKARALHEATEASLASLSSLLPSKKSSKPASKQPTKTKFANDDSSSDFGEETHLSTRDAAAKASKKKSLKFYTSQITQKSQKRVGAGLSAGGDEDLPYRERMRDRQARLNAEAEKRGKILDASGRGNGKGGKNIELDGAEASGDDAEVGGRKPTEDDEYYNLITRTTSSKKASKAAALSASHSAAQAQALDRIRPDADLSEDAKRAIGYTIEKNKGLAPKRKKEVRNPRVKKRMKFEEKKKKLGSMKAIYKGGEERGGYGGEKTGIKPGLVKSIKL